MSSAPPFFILSMPRALSAWVANLLTTQVTWCGHDAIEFGGHFAKDDDFLVSGAIGSDVVFYANSLLREHPGARFAALVRPVDSIISSARRAGYIVSKENLDLLSLSIRSFASEVNCPVFDFGDLDVRAVIAIWEHCLPNIPPCHRRIDQLMTFNIQTRHGQRRPAHPFA